MEKQISHPFFTERELFFAVCLFIYLAFFRMNNFKAWQKSHSS